MLKRSAREHESPLKGATKFGHTPCLFPCLSARARANSASSSSPPFALAALQSVSKDFPNTELCSTAELGEKCESATRSLVQIVKSLKLKEAFAGVLSDEVVKVVAECIRHCSAKGFGEEVGKELEALNIVLMMGLEDRPRKIRLGKYIKSTLETLKATQDHIKEQSNFRNLLSSARILSFQYHTLTILTTLNACNDSFVQHIETLSRGIRESLLNNRLHKCYSLPLGQNECWVSEERAEISCLFGREKIAVVRMGSGCRVTTRCVCLGYVEKAFKGVVVKGNQVLLEKVLETIAETLKDISERLKEFMGMKLTIELGEVEIYLNEALICFSILRWMLANLSDPFALLSKFGYVDLLKPLLDSYIGLILRLGLVKGSFKDSEVVSYKTAHDYLSGVFLFMSELKNKRELLSYGRAAKGAGAKSLILGLFEEVIQNLVKEIDKTEKIATLKHYIVEYFYRTNRNFSRQTAECLVSLVESRSIFFTAPRDFAEGIKETRMQSLTNKRAITLLNTILNDDKMWAETVLNYMLELVKEHYRNVELLFGIYKLIYCGVTDTICNNSMFYEKMFSRGDRQDESSKHAMGRESSKATKGFVDIEGITQLINILLCNLYKEDFERVGIVVEMTGNFIIELLDVALIAEQLLKRMEIVVKVLEESHSTSFTIKFIRKLLLLVKYSPKIVTADKGNYLPLTLMEMARSAVAGKNMKKALTLVALVVDFLSHESGASVAAHQAALSESVALQMLLVETESSAPFVGEVVLMCVRLVYHMQKQNDTVAESIKKSKLIAGKQLHYFVKSKIEKVFHAVTQ